MIGHLELLVIIVLALILFRAEDYADMLHTWRRIRTPLRDFSRELSDAVISPLREIWSELHNDGKGER